MLTSGPAASISTKLYCVNSERIPGFGKRVQEVLDAANINQTQAMRRLGVAYTTITKWVNERGAPSIVNIVPLAELGGVHIEWLITGKGPKYVDETRNAAAHDADRERRAGYLAAVEAYLASPLAEDISPRVASMLKSFDFASLGIQRPRLKDVHTVRDLMDLQQNLGHFGPDGEQG